MASHNPGVSHFSPFLVPTQSTLSRSVGAETNRRIVPEARGGANALLGAAVEPDQTSPRKSLPGESIATSSSFRAIRALPGRAASAFLDGPHLGILVVAGSPPVECRAAHGQLAHR
jgi:hypothetical protein